MLQLGVEMEKIRISSLAKELGVKSVLLIEKCHEKGLTHINHHANTLVPEQAEMIKQLFQPSKKTTLIKEEPKVKDVVVKQAVEQKKDDTVISQANKAVKPIHPGKVVRIHKDVPQQQRVMKVTPTNHIGRRSARQILYRIGGMGTWGNNRNKKTDN